MNKYEVRWSNGYWKMFDTEEYKSVAIFYLKTTADEAVAKKNVRA